MRLCLICAQRAEETLGQENSSVKTEQAILGSKPKNKRHLWWNGRILNNRTLVDNRLGSSDVIINFPSNQLLIATPRV